MSSKIFKISAVATTIAASFAANAALYDVYLEAPEGTSTNLLTYGVAISPETVKSGTNTCWDEACDKTTSIMATEVKRYREGFNYRDEAPFFLPFGWDYLDDNWDGFKRYCRDYLGYADTLCENWATAQYTNGYAREQGGNYDSSIAYLDVNRNGTATEVQSQNAVVNSVIDDGSIKAVGSTQDSTVTSYRSLKGFVGATDFTTSDTEIISANYWTQKTLTAGTFTVGSIVRDNVEVNNKIISTSKPTIWRNSAPLSTEINWQGNRTENGNSKAQGSVRDIIEDSATPTTLYAVGYTSDNEVRLKAAVFKSTDSGSTWSTGTLVDGFPFATEEYVNQTLQAVNNNKKAIGTAKLRRALNGAYSNTLFYVPDVSVATPKYTEFSGSIFFEGANGLAGNINNHNDVVGTVDFETHAETNGKPRAQRAFITNLGTAPGTVPGSAAPIGGQARYLDDLTNGSASTDNNQFRIIQAADINDAGVIAATAYYCAGGFDSTAIDAKCTAGASLAGVKLVPISGRTANDITPRPVTQTTVERQGGSLGILVLTVLGLLGFRRK
ncbi:DUF3466 family protein [Vibrio europaeus]|uniref:DUF3466 family protein n=1 Tax=Vibrio europaeus TaxID=300876 RepID=A0A178JFT1_9VIBR|nr:DUF3466 family protein [Vibrio europaeus]MDC5706379.1 DUF3466 family protein [Vibrio europaeus]MDC5711694.1 DUF3466 family protein [Vibrio europaeus]MDC5716169.1 DUF3466 family protein [Vibrio europaeus]MDC5720925.1 DUF3466 family protein [Vibrio europaeus]MDC5723204.1 DUF3466 family protein [Vibrio europaeus]